MQATNGFPYNRRRHGKPIKQDSGPEISLCPNGNCSEAARAIDVISHLLRRCSGLATCKVVIVLGKTLDQQST